MDSPSGYITLDGLLSLNIDQVQAHLNSVQWPDRIAVELDDVFYRETRAIFLITTAIDAFLEQTIVISCFTSQSHLLALRLVLLDEHQARLIYLSNYHGFTQ